MREGFTIRPAVREAGLLLILYAAAAALLLWLYPYPLVTTDSHEYMRRAKELTLGPFRPIGYSLFLRLLHEIRPTGLFVFAVQFALHAAASLAFIFAVRRLFPPRNRWAGGAFALVTALNPFAVYLTMMLMSDSLFSSLTLAWLATGLWMLRRPGAMVAVAHCAALVCAMNVRPTGMIYPLVSVPLFLAAGRRSGVAWAVVAVALAVLTHQGTALAMKRTYGARTFSAMGGWYLANNAVAIIPHVRLDPVSIEDPQLRAVHEEVLRAAPSFFSTEAVMDCDFMWRRDGPGKQSIGRLFKGSGVSYGEAWVRTGVVMGRYGRMLIRRYPLEYFRWHVLPSMGRFFFSSRLVVGEPIQTTDAVAAWYGVPAAARPYRHLVPSAILGRVARWVWPACWLALAASITAAFRSRPLAGWDAVPTRAFLVLALFVAVYSGGSVLASASVMRFLVPVQGALAAVIYILAGSRPRSA